jgi:hypothetical protein
VSRFEKLAVNFLAMVELAMIRRCFRLLEPSDRTWAYREAGPVVLVEGETQIVVGVDLVVPTANGRWRCGIDLRVGKSQQVT